MGTVKRRHRKIARGFLLGLLVMKAKDRAGVVAALLEELLAARGLVAQWKDEGEGS